MPNFLLQLSVLKLPNRMLSTPEEGGLTNKSDSDNNIIISDSTLHNVLPTQQKKRNDHTKSFVVVIVAYIF